MKNWKTTILGAIAAILVAIQPIIEAAQGGEINWVQLGFAAALAAMGYLSKDAGVTGTEK